MSGRKPKQARVTRGSLTVSSAGNADIIKRLRQLQNGGEVAIQKTVSDFASRAPAWVSKGIREHYGVDTGAIKEAAKKPRRGRTTINVAGITVDGVTLEYSGRTLTPLHFKMSPKQRPTALQNKTIRAPVQAIAQGSEVAMLQPPKPYKVKATIIKGQRVTLGSETFVAPGKGGVNLPFQRVTEKRKPVEVIRTLSVPQMIDGRAKETIEQTINEQLGKRFQHYVERVTK